MDLVSTQGLPALKRHDEYYFELVVFLVENTLFSVPKEAFLVPGTTFDDMFQLPTAAGSPLEGQNDAHPIHLEQIKASAFESFVRVLYPLKRPPNTFEEWLGVLDLATMWKFKEVRKRAIDALSAVIHEKDPLENVMLAKRYHVGKWLTQGYTNLLEKSSLTIEDLRRPVPCNWGATVLDWETVARLLAIRIQGPTDSSVRVIQRHQPSVGLPGIFGTIQPQTPMYSCSTCSKQWEDMKGSAVFPFCGACGEGRVEVMFREELVTMRLFEEKIQVVDAANAASKAPPQPPRRKLSHGGSGRGDNWGDFAQVGPDGWAVGGSGSGAPRPPPKAGDLSNFGKISKAQPIIFGPSRRNKGPEAKRESIVPSSQVVDTTEAASNVPSEPPRRKRRNPQPCPKPQPVGAVGHADAASEAPPKPSRRKRLVLQPRSKPQPEEMVDPSSPVAEPDAENSDDGAQEATKKIAEDSKEFFGVRNLEEAEVYFVNLPAQYHFKLVDELVSTAVESKEVDARLVSDFFARVVSKGLSTAAAFEKGFTPIAEVIDDIAIDAPKAFQLFAMMIQGAGLDESRRSSLASKSMDSDKLLALLH